MQKIEIKDFFAIKEAKLDLDKILLLIGEQASGKSTVAKLVYFFKCLRQEILANITLDNISFNDNSDAPFHALIWGAVRRKFYSFFGSTRHLPDFEIKFYYTEEKYIQLSLNNDKSLKIYFSPSLHRPIFEQRLPGLIQMARQRQSGRPQGFYAEVAYLEALKNIEEFIASLFEDKRRPFFIPAGRNATVSFGDQFKSRFLRGIGSEIEAIEQRYDQMVDTSPSVDLYLISEFIDRVDGMKDRFRNSDFEGMLLSKIQLAQEDDLQLNSNGANTAGGAKSSESQQISNLSNSFEIVLQKITSILKGRYKLDHYGEKIFYAENSYVDLNDASSGQQESIRILQDLFLVLLDNESVFRVIEEPEAHLYPLAQKHLIELIALMLNRTESQVVITTHSPYILSIFTNLLYAAKMAEVAPTKYGEIVEVIPAACWLSPDSFHAYALADGKSKSIMDKETGLIDQNFLDEISERLADNFNQLYAIHAEAVQ